MYATARFCPIFGQEVVLSQLSHKLTESGVVPDTLVRHGIRQLLRKRLAEIAAADIEASARRTADFVAQMQDFAIAEVPEIANEQHYEVDPAFFRASLGPNLKYSCAFWHEDTESLEQAEAEALNQTCDRADLKDGQRILELGCGWGSLTLWMAAKYPNSRITAVSNSSDQARTIQERAAKQGLSNIQVETADMNDFKPEGEFDRIVSVEMFEHMRNWPALYARVASWLKPDGKFFKHIFVHRQTPYLFEARDASDWMSRHFFSGGIMPSADLPLFFQEHLLLDQRWFWNGEHYEKTCNAWLDNMDQQKAELMPIFERIYGKDFAKTWWMRWRMFYMACAELFAFNHGQEWFVGHYLFRKHSTTN